MVESMVKIIGNYKQPKRKKERKIELKNKKKK